MKKNWILIDQKIHGNKVACSADGSLIVIGSQDRLSLLFTNAGQGIDIPVQQDISSVACSKDGTTVIAASGREIVIYQAHDNDFKEQMRISQPQQLRAVTCTADGSLIIALAEDGLLTIFDNISDTRTVRQSITLKGSDGSFDAIRAVACDDDGSTLAVATGYFSVRLLKNNGTLWQEAAAIFNINDSLHSITCTANGSVIFAGTDAATTLVLTEKDGKLREVTVLAERSFGLHGTYGACNANGSIVVSACEDGNLRIFEKEGKDWHETATFTTNSYYCSVACSDDASVIVAGLGDGTAQMYRKRN
jgi:WD40 repeat protein